MSTTYLILLSAFGLVLLIIMGVLLKRRPWRGSCPKYPVVLTHGLLGFSKIGVANIKQDYFRGIVDHLKELGIEVYCPNVAPTSSIEERAKQLSEQIEKIPAKQVNIISHSMGGLDARYAITHFGLANKVACLISIGTPHFGTPIAIIGGILRAILMKTGLVKTGFQAFSDLTTSRMEVFNKNTPNVANVRYACIVASMNPQKASSFLIPTYKLLNKRIGENDGLVPIKSQLWGKLLWQIKADHLAQIGWSQEGWDEEYTIDQFYQKITTRIRSWGF